MKQCIQRNHSLLSRLIPAKVLLVKKQLIISFSAYGGKVTSVIRNSFSKIVQFCNSVAGPTKINNLNAEIRHSMQTFFTLQKSLLNNLSQQNTLMMQKNSFPNENRSAATFVAILVLTCLILCTVYAGTVDEGVLCSFVCLFFSHFCCQNYVPTVPCTSFFSSPTSQDQAVCRLVSKNKIKCLCFVQFRSEWFKFGSGSYQE